MNFVSLTVPLQRHRARILTFRPSNPPRLGGEPRAACTASIPCKLSHCATAPKTGPCCTGRGSGRVWSRAGRQIYTRRTASSKFPGNFLNLFNSHPGRTSLCGCFPEVLTSRKRVQKYGLSASHATIATTFFKKNTKKRP